MKSLRPLCSPLRILRSISPKVQKVPLILLRSKCLPIKCQKVFRTGIESLGLCALGILSPDTKNLLIFGFPMAPKISKAPIKIISYTGLQLLIFGTPMALEISNNKLYFPSHGFLGFQWPHSIPPPSPVTGAIFVKTCSKPLTVNFRH